MPDFTNFTNLGIDGTEITATAAEINAACDGVTATAAELNSAAKTVKTRVDASAGGTGQTTAITGPPAGSLLLNIGAVVVTPFDGDTTTTIEIGLAANADKYIDTVDLDPSAAAGTNAQSLGGTTNDQTTLEYLAAAPSIIATWTNTANMTEGAVDVYVTYIELP